MKIGIFGGTFDPVHKAHLEIAKISLESLGLDRILFMPSYIPPHKTSKISSYENRLAMLKIVTKNKSEFFIEELEKERKGKSYTKESLELLKIKYEDAKLYFIMGEDSFLNFHTWYKYEEIFKLVNLVVFSRKLSTKKEIKDLIKKYKNEYNANITYLDFDKDFISSSYIRENLEKAYELGIVDLDVYTYIKEKGIYD